MASWWSEKGPGVKILWVWAFGTAAVVVAASITSRLREMDKSLKEEDAARFQSGPAAAASSQERVITDE